jgi:hypothetical protein
MSCEQSTGTRLVASAFRRKFNAGRSLPAEPGSHTIDSSHALKAAAHRVVASRNRAEGWGPTRAGGGGPSQVATIYAHVLPSMQQDAADRLEALLQAL